MNINQLYTDFHDEQFALYARHMNPQLVRVLKTIGFDRPYVRAEGAYLIDRDGHRYLDMLSGYGVFSMGRAHPTIKAALHAAIDADLPNMIQMDAPLPAALLAQKITSLMPEPLEMVFFTNSGTEAMEGAMKFAKCATGRNRFVYIDHAFHGLTNGSLSVNGSACFKEGFGELLPHCVAIDMNDIAALEKELSKKQTAAFIIEAVQGKTLDQPTTDFFKQAESLCRKTGTMLIADEVQSGFGRTGKWFAFQHHDITPDIVTVAKALSGGFIPVGAIVYRRDIYDKVFSKMDRCVVHSNTYGRNMMAMIAGLASLDVIESEGLVANADKQGKAIRDGLNAMKDKYEMIGEIKGRGMMIGVEFKSPKSLTLKAGWKLIHAANEGLFGQMVVVPLFTKHRILSQVAGNNTDLVRFLPPLILTDEDVATFLTAFDSVMADCHRFPGGAWEVGKQLAKASWENRKVS